MDVSAKYGPSKCCILFTTTFSWTSACNVCAQDTVCIATVSVRRYDIEVLMYCITLFEVDAGNTIKVSWDTRDTQSIMMQLVHKVKYYEILEILKVL